MAPLRLALVCALAASVTACGTDSTAPGTKPGRKPNEVHLHSDAGDYIGGGNKYSYDQSDAVISVTSSGGLLSVSVTGDQSWTGQFQSPSGMTQLQAGTYSNLQRYPFHDPAVGGLNWFGNGAGCNTLAGWFVVDRVVYTSGSLTALDMRFEQRCEEGVPALHGVIHLGG